MMTGSDVEKLVAYASEQIPEAQVKDVSSEHDDETYFPVLRFEFEPDTFRYLLLTRELWDHKQPLDELSAYMEHVDWVHEVRESGHKFNLLGELGWLTPPALE
jgi:hypothetical protein